MEYGPFLSEKLEYISKLPVEGQIKELITLSPETRGIFTHSYFKERNMSDGIKYIHLMIENVEDPLELDVSLGGCYKKHDGFYMRTAKQEKLANMKFSSLAESLAQFERKV